MATAFPQEVGEGAVHKPHEAVNVGCNGVQFCTGMEINVLVLAKCAMKLLSAELRRELFLIKSGIKSIFFLNFI